MIIWFLLTSHSLYKVKVGNLPTVQGRNKRVINNTLTPPSLLPRQNKTKENPQKQGCCCQCTYYMISHLFASRPPLTIECANFIYQYSISLKTTTTTRNLIMQSSPGFALRSKYCLFLISSVVKHFPARWESGLLSIEW